MADISVLKLPDNTSYNIKDATARNALVNKTAVSGGTELSLVTTGDKYNWNNKTSNQGTVTSIATSGAITGGTITTTGTISHSTSAGYKHIPSGGSSGQVLKYSASGTATWSTP